MTKNGHFYCDWCCRPGTKERTATRPKDGKPFDLCREYCWDVPEVLWMEAGHG